MYNVTITFNVNGQIISRNEKDAALLSDSIDLIKARFIFSPEWQGYVKTAIFKSSTKKPYSRILVDDACMVPPEAIKKSKYMSVSVFGVLGTQLITATDQIVPLTPSGYTDDSIVSPAPTENVYQQIVTLMQRQAVDGVTRIEYEDGSLTTYNQYGQPLDSVEVGGGSGTVQEIVAGDGIAVEQDDQARPVISVDPELLDDIGDAVDTANSVETRANNGEFNGKDGADGAPGPPGADGKDGADGATGPPGADGKDGAKGDPGEKGAKGDPGEDGQDGNDGVDGQDGTPATATAGTTTTLSPSSDATVTNVGTTQNAIFNFGIPRGADGVDGAKGDPGQDGADGYTPIKGVDYFDGKDGKDGEKGEQGDPGDIESLNSQHIEDALGYSPVSPTQLNSKVQTDVPVDAKFTDTVYSHPTSHPASMITESSTKRFVSDSEKSTWNSKSDTDTVTTINGKTGAITKSDITALGIPSQDTDTTYSEITTAEIDTGTASTLRTITARRLKYLLDKIVALFPSKTSELTNDSGFLTSVNKADVGLGNVDNTSDLNKPISTATQTALDNKVDDSRVLTDVPLNAEFTDTVTTINSKTGIITKADIVALGIPAQDTVYTHPAGTNPHGTTKADVGLGSVTNDKQMPISDGVLENYREKLVTLSGTSTSINLNNGNVFTHTLSGNTTYSISNAVSGQAHSFTLIINMGATVRTLTFPASIKWQGGEIPDVTTASKTYVLTFMTIDGGSNWLGIFGGKF